MKMPKVLKSFNLFVDGVNQYGVLVDITRPKISRQTETCTPGGWMAGMTVVHGLEKLTMEITSKGYDADILKSMSGSIGGKLLRYQGALQEEDGTSYQTLKGEARGRITEADPGRDKQGGGGEHKFAVELVYWKESLDGAPIVEIDVIANKAAFGGIDERAGLRAALGL